MQQHGHMHIAILFFLQKLDDSQAAFKKLNSKVRLIERSEKEPLTSEMMSSEVSTFEEGEEILKVNKHS